MSFPHVTRLRHAGTGLSGNLAFKSFMDTR